MTQLFNNLGPTNEYGLLEHGGAFELSTVLDVTLDETTATNPLTQNWRWLELTGERAGDLQRDFSLNPDGEPDGQRRPMFERFGEAPVRRPEFLSEEEQTDKIRTEKLEKELTAVDGETREGLALRIKWKKEELSRRAVLSNTDGAASTAVAQFGVGLLGSMLDPINVASGFVPILGVSRYAGILAKQASAIGRFSVRARRGAAEGLVGAAMVEPLVLMATEATQYDYDLYDSFANLVFGTVLGGGLHGIGGAVKDNLVRRRMLSIIDGIDEKARREVFETALGQVMSGRHVTGVDTMLRKALDENNATERVVGGRPDREIVGDSDRFVTAEDEGVLSGATLKTVYSDDSLTQTSYKNVEDAQTKATKLEEQGFTATVRSLGEDNHRIDIAVPNDFVRAPDGEYLTFKNKMDAVKHSHSLIPEGTLTHPTKVGDEWLLYDLTKLNETAPKTIQDVVSSLNASADEINIPLEVPVMRSVDRPDADAPTLQEKAAADAQEANSDSNLVGEMQEREVAVEANRLLEDTSEALDLPEIEAETANIEAEVERLRAEIGEEAATDDFVLKGRKQLDQADEALKKTQESEDAFKQAAICVLGALG